MCSTLRVFCFCTIAQSSAADGAAAVCTRVRRITPDHCQLIGVSCDHLDAHSCRIVGVKMGRFVACCWCCRNMILPVLLRWVLVLVLVLLPVTACCCICFSHQYAHAAVEHFALGLISACSSVEGVQRTTMADDNNTAAWIMSSNVQHSCCEPLPEGVKALTPRQLCAGVI